jgi:hypothetical protein
MATNVAVVAKPDVEEIHYHKGDVSLCLMINRRTRSLRVVDFRAGTHPLKREVVEQIARDEGLERAYTVVEREEAPSWLRLGFHKEGNIPGFYKRSDAYLLGMAIEPDSVQESGMRIALHARPEHAMGDRAERAYQAGRRMMREKGADADCRVKVQLAKESDVGRSLATAMRAGRALTQFEPFGRDGVRSAYLGTARGGFSVLVGVEGQPCFDNAYVDVLTAPRSEKEAFLTASALTKVSELLEKQGVVSSFAITLAESVEMTAAFVTAGFRRTGRLPNHLLVRNERQDAFLWSRKLADTDHD